jgi:hypothetical protein
LIWSLAYLFPCWIHWWNMRVKGKETKFLRDENQERRLMCNKSYKHKKSKLCFLLELFLLFCNKTTIITTWKWRKKKFSLPHCSKFWKGVVLWWSIYDNKKVKYSFISVLKNPKMHRSNNWRCIMVDFMFAYVTSAILVNVFVVNYVTLTCDKVNTMDNDNWISIHAYVM